MPLEPAPLVLKCPSLTVLIPHYSEDIYTSSKALDKSASPSLLEYLVEYFPDEFKRFYTTFLYDKLKRAPDASSTDEKDWPLRKWASRRLQTLYRTVHGMEKYRDALKLLLEHERPADTPEAREVLLDAKFSIVVSMPRPAWSLVQR